jgi:hypothetical protein
LAPPLIEIDESMLEGLASIGCTVEELGLVLGCSPDTLQRRYAAVLKKGRMMGLVSLRRMQFQAAREGNITMMIWLGKQLLGQKDKLEDSTRNLDRIDALIAAIMLSGSMHESKDAEIETEGQDKPEESEPSVN